MADWPVAADLDSYLDISQSKVRTDVRDMVLAVATEMIAERCDIPHSGYAKPADISATMRQCILLMAARLYRRQKSPDGIAGTTEGFIIRVNRVDPDIEAMLLSGPGRIPIGATGTDYDAPELTLLGDNPLSLSVGNAYVEPGYTAIDAHDGDITTGVEITGVIDVNTPGTYELTYTSTDRAGNYAVDYREVIVV